MEWIRRKLREVLAKQSLTLEEIFALKKEAYLHKDFKEFTNLWRKNLYETAGEYKREGKLLSDAIAEAVIKTFEDVGLKDFTAEWKRKATLIKNGVTEEELKKHAYATVTKWAFQDLMLKFGYDTTVDTFQVQKRLNFPYTVDEVLTNTAILFGFLAPQLGENRLWFLDSKYVGWVKKYIENSLRFDPFVEMRAIVYSLRENIVQVYVFNSEFFEIRRPILSILDLFTLPKEEIKQRLEFIRLMGKDMSNEIVDYGFGFSPDVEPETGAMAIPYRELPAITVVVSSLYG
jgi:hypothetical protein